MHNNDRTIVFFIEALKYYDFDIVTLLVTTQDMNLLISSGHIVYYSFFTSQWSINSTVVVLKN